MSAPAMSLSESSPLAELLLANRIRRLEAQAAYETHVCVGSCACSLVGECGCLCKCTCICMCGSDLSRAQIKANRGRVIRFKSAPRKKADIKILVESGKLSLRQLKRMCVRRYKSDSVAWMRQGFRDILAQAYIACDVVEYAEKLAKKI
jgi:hypothetical protein